MYEGFQDYAVDKRGDVGSWVRQESMVQMYRFVDLIVSCGKPDLVAEIIADQGFFYERLISAYF